MYLYTVCFSDPNDELKIKHENETETRLFNSYIDALEHLRFDTEMDLKNLNKNYHPAQLSMDELNGCAQITIKYDNHTEHITYNINKLKVPTVTKPETNNLQQYNVSVAVDARAYIKVMATDPEDARHKAMDEFMEFQCGDLEDIDAHAVNCEDETGNLTDY